MHDDKPGNIFFYRVSSIAQESLFRIVSAQAAHEMGCHSGYPRTNLHYWKTEVPPRIVSCPHLFTVERVHYPGLPSSPSHALASKLFRSGETSAKEEDICKRRGAARSTP